MNFKAASKLLFGLTLLCSAGYASVYSTPVFASMEDFGVAPSIAPQPAVRPNARPYIRSYVQQSSFDDAVNLALQKKASQALEILSRLENDHKVSPDLLHITRARIYFQTNKLDDAIKEYNQVKETSALWLSAIDEKAQAYGRKGEYAKVTSTLQTAMAPMFTDRVSPEIFFTAALTDLKICDYSSVFKITEQFKKIFAPRLAKLAAQRKSANRNDKLNAAVAIKAINDVTNKLQVIEAEVIERITLAQKNDNRPEQGQIQSGTDVLRFKVTDDVWVDELDSYQSKIKECPTNPKLTGKRASL